MSDLPPPPPGGPRYPAGPPTRPPSGDDGWTAPGAPEDTGAPGGGDAPAAAGRGRRVGIAAAVAAVLALLVATVVVVNQDDGDTAAVDDPVVSAPPPEAGEEPDAPDEPPAEEPSDPITEDELRALVDELQAYVAEARGLDFLRPVVVELADDEAFEARLVEKFEEDLDQVEQAEVFYQALGLIDPGTSLVDLLRQVYSASVLGFYDPETDELLVRGAELSPYVRQIVVHELVHALDDQHFELFREPYDDRKDEIAIGFTAVTEGNARRIEERWLGDQPEDVREEARAEEQDFGEGMDVGGIPEILLFEIGAPYELGEIFVGALSAQGGERAVDGAFEDPPTTSEQVLFPPLYVDRQPRVEVPPPPADGDVVDDGVVGALFWFGLFTTGDSPVAPQDAFRAIEGWGGDWAVTWEDGDAACVRIDVVGDTDEDTSELEGAMSAWAEESAAAEVSTVDDRIRLESCVAGAAGGSPQV